MSRLESETDAGREVPGIANPPQSWTDEPQAYPKLSPLSREHAGENPEKARFKPSLVRGWFAD
jgi:hypothetical protein